MTDKIGQIDSFDTEAELDEFAFDMTSFAEGEHEERLAKGNTYGPPVVFAFTAKNLDAIQENNFERPVAIYLRGERYDCVKRE
jgi:hypothetical protein